MNQADEAWVQELYRYNAPKLYKVVLRRLEDAEAAQAKNRALTSVFSDNVSRDHFNSSRRFLIR